MLHQCRVPSRCAALCCSPQRPGPDKSAAFQEYQLSAYAPCAPPEGSKLRQVFVTVALGAMSQGKWSCAEKCLKASGEELLLLLLHALQHNRAALQQAVAQSGGATAMHTLSMLLLAADARIGLRQLLQKDWHMSRCAPHRHAMMPHLAAASFCCPRCICWLCMCGMLRCAPNLLLRPS
jgi:hypothetical protein